MKQKREYERLSKLFSDIEVLALNPAGRTSEREAASQPAPYQSAPGEPALNPENNALPVETNLLTDVQVEGQSSDEVSLRENDQIESMPLKEKTDALLESALSLPDVSSAIHLPLTTQGSTIVERPIDQPQAGQFQSAESSPIDWQKMGIGLLTGILATGIILACTSRMHVFNNLGRLVLLIWEVLCGIVGALAAKSSKSKWRAAWVGAIQWSLVPIWIALVIISLIYLLMYTNLFGV